MLTARDHRGRDADAVVRPAVSGWHYDRPSLVVLRFSGAQLLGKLFRTSGSHVCLCVVCALLPLLSTLFLLVQSIYKTCAVRGRSKTSTSPEKNDREQ